MKRRPLAPKDDRHTCNKKAEGTVKSTMAGWKQRGKYKCRACAMEHAARRKEQ